MLTVKNKIKHNQHVAALIFGLTITLLTLASPAQGQKPLPIPVNACGYTMKYPGEYVLAADLDCSGTFANGFNIAASNVVFHLAGHTLSSTDCDGTKTIYGIFVPGNLTGVKIDGGIVTGFNDGIVLSSSKSRVTGMTVKKACFFGIAVQGTKNRVDENFVSSSAEGIGLQVATYTHIVSNDVSGNPGRGIDLANHSDHNYLQNNIINDNGGEGVMISFGTDNHVQQNSLRNNLQGIRLDSPVNFALHNVVSGSRDTGIWITGNGSSSTVLHNTVLGSTLVDMLDDQRECDSNLWRRNTFLTDLVAGVPDGGPGVGCLQ